MSVTVGDLASLVWVEPAAGTGEASLTVTLPDSSTLTPAVATQGGQLTASLVTSLPGRHLLVWERAGRRYVDVLDVWPADPRYLVALADVRATLGSTPGDLALQVAVATWIVEHLVGPVLPRSVQYRPERGAGVAVLPDVDVAAVTVLVDGVPSSVVVDVDEVAGIVSGLPSGSVTISYTVGSTSVPLPLQQAARDIAVHLYRSSRQGGGPGRPEAAADTVATPYGFAIPRRAYELCQAVGAPAPGFA